MTTIRIATVADVPVLVEMGRHQVAELYGGVVADNVVQLRALTEQMVMSANHVVFIAERGGRPIGMIGMILFTHHISGERAAGEVAWYLEPDARGDGKMLLRAAERWAAEHGATVLQMMAPNDRVGALYQRLGYRLLEMTYVKPVTAAMTAIRVIDDVFEEPSEYAAQTRQQTFRDVQTSPDVLFHGIAPPIDDRLPRWLAEHYPELTPTLTFVRQSPEHQDEPNYIHTDRDMGDFTVIYYLTDQPPDGDGTTFWRNKVTGAIASRAQSEQEFIDEWMAWRDLSQWEPWHTVAAKPNRAVLFPAPYFHSRAIKDNYGDGDTSRLIQVLFGVGELPC